MWIEKNILKSQRHYFVKDVISHKIEPNGDLRFLVRWMGYSSKEDTWEPEETVKGTDCLEKYYHKVNLVHIHSPNQSDNSTLNVWIYVQNVLCWQ